MDDDQRYTAASSKDARFDGVFFCAVRTTGTYCRPSCPAITPKRANVAFYPTAAAAQQAGFRACKRCRPDASPGSPEWNVRSDVAGRAMRLIADGVVDRAGVSGLASSLGYSSRQVGRLLTAEVGAGPLALARAQRARTARILVETTALPMGDIAFAAGFASIRQFNATMLEVYDTPPSVLRERAMRRGGSARARARAGSRRGATGLAGTAGLVGTAGLAGTAGGAAADDGGATGVLHLRLPFRPPIDLSRMFGFLAARAIPGIEVASPDEYKRTVSLPNGSGVLSLRPVPGASWVDCSLALSDLRDVTAAVQRCRRLLDLDADPWAISGFFADDPVIGPLAADCPGRRAVGAVDGSEIAIRAVLGQQVSVAAARRLGARLVALCGTPLAGSVDATGLAGGLSVAGGPGPGAVGGALTHLFPDVATIAGLAPADLPMPLARGRALMTLASALASGAISLDPGADREEAGARLLALPGIGPWTAGYIRMRALSDPDVFLPGDVGVMRALRQLTAGEADAVRLGTDGPGAIRSSAGGAGPDGLNAVGSGAGSASAAGSSAGRSGGSVPRSRRGRLSGAERWRPWCSYATHHLWATLESAPSRTAGTRDDDIAV
jgi:AraC family transcriptional regulator of adaptative response / DNA-3-methyladenine glycosylase II